MLPSFIAEAAFWANKRTTYTRDIRKFILGEVKQCSTFHKGFLKTRKKCWRFVLLWFFWFVVCLWPVFAVLRKSNVISQATGIVGDVNISFWISKPTYSVIGAHIGPSFIVIIVSPVIILRHSSLRFYRWSDGIIHAKWFRHKITLMNFFILWATWSMYATKSVQYLWQRRFNQHCDFNT